ncbi:Uncharacterised protein [uncultured archaeon]|nr:Uncharacterised protein [uncultured archaeon]
MIRTGSAYLPLHGGHAPHWLFKRMVRLSGAISEAVVEENGSAELLARFSDTCWFQAFACAIGFDWHSSGTTTTACGALKLALKPDVHGVVACGGKGATSRKTPSDISSAVKVFDLPEDDASRLAYASKMAAKADTALLQDGFQLYHHSFFMDAEGKWAVIQQGMDESYARRYHWLSECLPSFVETPHTAVASDICRDGDVLDLTAKESEETRKISVELIQEGPCRLRCLLGETQTTLAEYDGRQTHLTLSPHHPVLHLDISPEGWRAIQNAYEIQPRNYEELASLDGMGPMKIRALALVAELIYGAKTSTKDPVRYSFAHGGKDGFPYPVHKQTYDHTIQHITEAIQEARLGDDEKKNALKRLAEHAKR